MKVLKTQKSGSSEKVLFSLVDGALIESVYMTDKKGRRAVCLSSQAGCPIGCRFCATGLGGFKRNLTTAEIVGQAIYFGKKHRIDSLVFMGMGEPFLNLKNVLAAAQALNLEKGLNIPKRKMTFSTIGLPKQIKAFAQASKRYRLAWSLIATDDKKRRKLIPYKGLATIRETIKALKEYHKATGQRIIIEYVLLKGVNDSETELKKLAVIHRQIDSHLNIIAFNPYPGLPYETGDIDHAWQYLKSLGCHVTTRRSMGQEILAGCGQLLPTKRSHHLHPAF